MHVAQWNNGRCASGSLWCHEHPKPVLFIRKKSYLQFLGISPELWAGDASGTKTTTFSPRVLVPRGMPILHSNFDASCYCNSLDHAHVLEVCAHAICLGYPCILRDDIETRTRIVHYHFIAQRAPARCISATWTPPIDRSHLSKLFS